MIGHRRRRMPALLGGAVIAGIVLTGCGGPQMSPQETPSRDASFDDARAVNLEFKATVAAVQKQIFDGQWAVAEYGDTPQPCDEGYEFFLRRNLPDGFSFDGQGPQRMEELRTWLGDNGWQLAPTPTYGEGIENIVIMAGKPEAKVSRLDVDMVPANPAEGTIDVLELRATSTCEPGDAGALLDELRGPLTAVPSDDGIPDLESPDATPLFERFDEG